MPPMPPRTSTEQQRLQQPSALQTPGMRLRGRAEFFSAFLKLVGLLPVVGGIFFTAKTGSIVSWLVAGGGLAQGAMLWALATGLDLLADIHEWQQHR